MKRVIININKRTNDTIRVILYDLIDGNLLPSFNKAINDVGIKIIKVQNIKK